MIEGHKKYKHKEKSRKKLYFYTIHSDFLEIIMEQKWKYLLVRAKRNQVVHCTGLLMRLISVHLEEEQEGRYQYTPPTTPPTPSEIENKCKVNIDQL